MFHLMLMAIKYMAGIHAEIAETKCKYWSTFAGNPVDVVLAAGEKAKEETGNFYILCWKFFCTLVLVKPVLVYMVLINRFVNFVLNIYQFMNKYNFE